MTVVLIVPPEREERAKRLGAVYDRNRGEWIAPPSVDLAVLREFLPPAERRWIDLLEGRGKRRTSGGRYGR